MNKHSKGPWFKNKNRIIADANDHPVCLDGFSFGSHSTEKSQANTRRIVACINACEGFSIEELEGANLFKDSIESQSEIIAMKKQRDELLEALQYWLPKELPFPNQSNDSVCQKHNKQWNYAQKIIAKAGGNIPPSSQVPAPALDSKNILTENIKYE